MAKKTTKAKKKTLKPLRHRLVLNRWALNVLGIPLDANDPVGKLRDKLGDDEYRGVSEGHTRFCKRLKTTLFKTTHITDDQLDKYDHNIVEITRRLYPKEKLGEDFEWTWFQYVCLLLTEIYLDRYFNDRAGLKAELNAFVKQFNELREDEIPYYEEGDLNKIAFQNATGSGKTLLMHANILQYLHYSPKPKNIILLTPNEGLSKQHEGEFPDYVFAAELFQKDAHPLFASNKVAVKVLDYHDFAGDKKPGPNTVKAEFFEDNNLILVDEGHRGASNETGKWTTIRDRLSSDGFAFEYSATFSQAIDKASNELKNEYAKTVLFDFSYGEFYKDGYGKEYRILNVEGVTEAKKKDTKKIADSEFPYLVGSLLSFYQQVRYYDENKAKLVPFNVHRPLMVLVGASVSKSVSKGELSDVQELLAFFRDILQRPDDVKAVIKAVLNSDIVVQEEGGGDAFAGAFEWLKGLGEDADTLYTRLKKELFGSTESTLKVTLVSATGEIWLSVGSAEEPFGIINVGESGARSIFKVCEEELKLNPLTDKTSNEELFHKINKLDNIHVLIGSRKFTEGWNSWRVSTMGLLNLGKSEGAQVIQLFGRGVRLKGQRVKDHDGNEKGYSLKRSSGKSGQGIIPPFLTVIETLNVFGIHAKYMATFRDMLAKEGLDVSRKRTWEIPVIEVFRNSDVYNKLKIPVVPKGERGFRDAVKITLLEYFREHDTTWNVELNWFPRVESAISKGAGNAAGDDTGPVARKIPKAALAFMDWTSLYFDVQRMKYEIGHNLRVSPEDVREIFNNDRWYSLYLPKQDWQFSFDKRELWQTLASQLLQKLFHSIYNHRKGLYDADHRKYVTLKEAVAEGGEYAGIMPTWMLTMTDETAATYEQESIAALTAFAEAARKGKLDGLKLPRFIKEVLFDRHLYRPVFVKKGKGQITVSPVVLDEHEQALVEDTRKQCEAGGVLEKHEVYLLRNGSRGKGIGFAEAGNFYPDFVLWIVMKDCQHIVFLDPHGMGREDKDRLKVQFHEGIKDVERKIEDSTDETVFMHSYLLSTTDSQNEMDWMRSLEPKPLLEQGVVRMNNEDYLVSVINEVLSSPVTT